MKSVPGIPTSHPYIERLIGSARREGLNHILFLNEHDLQSKLNQFQEYSNDTRAHSSLEMKTPNSLGENGQVPKNVVSLDNYQWESHCGGLYKLPVAA